MSNSFKHVPRTGVIFVMAKAQERGFYYGNSQWSNLGQGAPETGMIEGSPARLTQIPLDHLSSEYSPVVGDLALRKAIAHLYNTRYRSNKASQYTYENVAIAPGGRAALTRIAAALGNVNLGHFLPDYTAYEELLNLFHGFVAIPLPYRESKGFAPQVADMEAAMVSMGLGAMLLSNPCNPTGQVIHGDALAQLIKASKTAACAMIFDEFYSHYLYGLEKEAISAASHVDDVDKDNVIIVDGLTKNWRYPGLRISWTLAPKSLITGLASAGSFLDGGAVHAIQQSTLPLVTPAHAKAESASIQQVFGKKRDYMVARLTAMGFVLAKIPEGSFYCFASLENLPEPLQDGMALFNALLDCQVICVPGEFFDVNPGQRRKPEHARLKKYVRFSFGPNITEIERGLDRVGKIVADAA